MSTRTSLVYEPLPHASECLRVLTVHAGNVLEPIRCSLRTISFREKPSYDALSYTWGDPNVTRPIEVNGAAVQVTSNLEQALQHLRGAVNDLTLWVDAVCINQSDLPEKSQQVAVMGQIYRKCAQVQIWLGCNASQCRLTQPPLSGSTVTGGISGEINPFSIIRLLMGDLHISEWSCFHAQEDHAHDDHGRGAVTYKANEDFNMMCEEFLAVHQSPWWTRIWTVQEATLPRTGLFIYDTWTMTLHSITDCGHYYYKHVWMKCCSDAESKLPGAIRTALKEFYNVASNLRDHRIRDENDGVSLLDLHVAYGFRECKDPRDKVYGLLGMTNDPLLRPDYTLSKGEVFFQATYRMLCHKRGDLKILTGPHYGPAPGKRASWAREFDAPLDRMHADIAFDRSFTHGSAHFDASGSHESSFVLLCAA